MWICDDCLDSTAVSGPIILQRSYTQRQKTPTPPFELKHVERPAELARGQWWSEAVQGWVDGRFTLYNIARDECVEIDLRSDQS